MTQEIALLRFRGARFHREHDLVRMERLVREAEILAQRCLDERQAQSVLLAMHELLVDLDVAIARMRETNAASSDALAAAAAANATAAGRMSCAIRMISRNPPECLHERPLSRQVLQALLGMKGRFATIDEIAAATGKTVKAVDDVMVAIHAAGFSALEQSNGLRRHAITDRGAHPSFSASEQTA
jgi:hypothetical protein